MLNSLKQPIYYCRRLQPQDEEYIEGITTFFAPKKRWLNIKTIDSEAVLLSGGEANQSTLIAKISNMNPDTYFENDQVFVDSIPPENFDPNDTKANYRITSVKKSHRVTEIIMKKMI